MARPVQKRIRELLDQYVAEQDALTKLEAKLDGANRPPLDAYEKAVTKNNAKFGPRIDATRTELGRLDKEIRLEIQKGYRLEDDSYSLTKVETDRAEVEVTTREQREISSEDWLDGVPKSEQRGDFYQTLKVMIAKAEKFRSDIVEKLAGKKRTHSVTVRMK